MVEGRASAKRPNVDVIRMRFTETEEDLARPIGTEMIHYPIAFYVDRSFVDADGKWFARAVTEIRRVHQQGLGLGINYYCPDAAVYLLDTLPAYKSGSEGLMLMATLASNNMLRHTRATYAVLLSYNRPNGGGAAFIQRDVIPRNYKYALAGCFLKRSDPRYTFRVVAHEVGHLGGSYHTQDCVWGGYQYRIDNCYPGAGGDCPSLNQPGCIMGYGGVSGSSCQYNYENQYFHPEVRDTLVAFAKLNSFYY